MPVFVAERFLLRMSWWKRQGFADDAQARPPPKGHVHYSPETLGLGTAPHAADKRCPRNNVIAKMVPYCGQEPHMGGWGWYHTHRTKKSHQKRPLWSQPPTHTPLQFPPPPIVDCGQKILPWLDKEHNNHNRGQPLSLLFCRR